MNIELLRNGYSNIIIPSAERNEYFDAIENNVLCEFLAEYELKALKHTYNERIKNGVIKDDETKKSGFRNDDIVGSEDANFKERRIHRHRR